MVYNYVFIGLIILAYFGDLLIPKYIKYIISKAKEDILKKVEDLQSGNISKSKNEEIKAKLLTEGFESKEIDNAIAISIFKNKTKDIDRAISIGLISLLFIVAEYFFESKVNGTILNILYIVWGAYVIYFVFIKKSNKK